MKKHLLLTIIFLSIQTLFSQTTIFMENDNGVYRIPCTVNGIPMTFIFDTGASDVSISSTEADFLIKQGLLKEEDIIGTSKYKIADGQIKDGTDIILREIKIKDLLVKDVKASVVHNQNAPLLLGQSVISRLGKIEIEGNRLTINPSNSINYDIFLGIDLTKKLNDFNKEISPYLTLKDKKDAHALTPIKLSDLNINENHPLKSFVFENQVIAFRTDENAQFVLFSKQAKNEEIGKRTIDELIDFFSKEYFKPTFKDYRSANWEFPNYQLIVLLNKDDVIQVLYGKKRLGEETKNSETNHYDDLSLNEKREFNVSTLNNIFNKSNDNDYKCFVRNENSQLQIFIERNLEKWFDKKLKYYSNEKKDELELYEKEYLENIAYNLFNPNKSQWLQECEFTTVIINGEYYYKKTPVRKKTVEFNVNDFFNLKMPYTKSEFKDIMK